MANSKTLWPCCKVLPTDYKDYGGVVERWSDPEEADADCSCGCVFFVPLEGRLGADWGVCLNQLSPRAGLLTWEHQAGRKCFRARGEKRKHGS